ncbi:hypothetical protein [Paraburkholderia sp. J41]|uniref:hypothetical protein n=1 Tax=Paraburkholderia sp. J41 TaxID=2805433 RepID=UPI002AC324CF|nr:hypothetical protein [Paraburkholderia sp. J41]
MKSVKIAVVACSLFAAGTVYAQNEAPATNASQHVAQNANAPAQTSAKPAKHDECVGPASFCNIYFGS